MIRAASSRKAQDALMIKSSSNGVGANVVI